MSRMNGVIRIVRQTWPGAQLIAGAKQVRDSRLGNAWLNERPVAVRLVDGTTHRAPRRVARLFDVWTTTPDLLSESRGVYAAYEGGDLIDVGAFHGWYSWLLLPKARPGTRFHSFEPDPNAYPILLKNLAALANVSKVVQPIGLPVPVGDGSPSSVWFPAGATGHPQYLSGATEGVRTTTIDEYIRTMNMQPSFVKIDVEGAEQAVLRGMLGTLHSHRPTVLIELHPHFLPDGVSTHDIRAILSGEGYVGTELSAGENSIRELWKVAGRE